MRKFLLTAAGLSSVAMCPGALADVNIVYDLSGPGGNQVDYDVEMSGELGDANITCEFVQQKDGWTWAGDMMIGVIDPAGNTVEYGSYNMSFGYPSAGDFPGSWDSSSSGTYMHSFSLGGYGLQGGGSWTVQFMDGYTGGLPEDHFSGTLSLLGMVDGNEPWGACCLGVGECFTGTQGECAANSGTFLGNATNCEGWPCGGAPEGACCFRTDCIDTDILDCGNLGGEFAGEGTTCAADACEIIGACCLGSDCSSLSPDACTELGGEFQGEDLDCADLVCGWDDPGQPTLTVTVGGDLVDGVPGSWTVDLFVVVGEGGRLDAVAGTGAQSKMLACSGDFYQNAYGGPTSQDVNPAFYNIEPNLEWDSRVTIGAVDSTGNPFPENALQDIGIDWADFENGGDMTTDDGVWWVLPTDEQGEAEEIVADDCSIVHAVRIARLTVMSMDDTISFEGIVQGTDANGVLFNDMAYIEAGYVAMEDCNDNGVNDTCDIANSTSSDDNGNGIPDECEACPGDADGDGDSDIVDILAVIAFWGTAGGANGTGDVDNNGVVNIEDLLQVIGWYGDC